VKENFAIRIFAKFCNISKFCNTCFVFQCYFVLQNFLLGLRQVILILATNKVTKFFKMKFCNILTTFCEIAAKFCIHSTVLLQCFGSESAWTPHSMAAWIRIQIQKRNKRRGKHSKNIYFVFKEFFVFIVLTGCRSVRTPFI
jgi:hypothetical protein